MPNSSERMDARLIDHGGPAPALDAGAVCQQQVQYAAVDDIERSPDRAHTTVLQMEESPRNLPGSGPAYEDESDNMTRSFWGIGLAALHSFFMMLPVVVVMLILTVVDVSFLIFEFSSGSERYEYVTLFTSFAFMVELLVHIGHLGPKRFFRYDRNWQIAETVIVSTSFVVEYFEFIIDHTFPSDEYHKYVAYMRAVRFLRVIIVAKTRSRTIIGAVRRLVSADRRRFQQDGYDLDLTYVLPHVIAMSWPSEKVEAMYRNHIDVVARFLDERHLSKYMVYNLCSERSYDESKFHHQVRRYRLDDHNPSELGMMVDFGEEVTRFLGGDPSRVAVIHCKGGKGRTGTMVCTYLLVSGLYRDATSALKQFGEQRTSHNAKSFQGVESPSQERYVRYLEALLKLRLPSLHDIPMRRVRLTRIAIYGVPKMYWDVGKLWFAIVTQPSTGRVVHYVSNPTVTFTHSLDDDAAATPGGGGGGGRRARTRTVAPDGTPDGLGGIEPFYGNMAISVRRKGQPRGAGRLVDGERFIEEYCPAGARDAWGEASTRFNASTTVSEAKSPLTDAMPDDPVVDIEFSTSAVQPFEGDSILKVFHNVDRPNTLKCPIQVWFHPSFEQDTMLLDRTKVDGPHKDTKGKKYSPEFAVEIGMQTVPGAQEEPEAAAAAALQQR